MSWLQRPEKKSSNPSTKFLEWSSNDKCFKYYDKATSSNKLVPLPFKFVMLEHYHAVKGWNDASESGIFSNEVLFIGSEPVTVKSFKGGEIASGLYKEIKPKITQAGGYYTRSVYAVDADGELLNISFKGSAVSNYSDFMKENENKNTSNWFSVSSAEDMKKGSVKYSVPVFEVVDAITKPEALQEKATILQEYMKPTSKGRENSEVDKYEAEKTAIGDSGDSGDLEF